MIEIFKSKYTIEDLPELLKREYTIEELRELFKMEYTTEEIMEVRAKEIEERVREQAREQAREQGIKQGIEEGIVRLYKETNDINIILKVYPEYSEQQLKEIFYNHNVIN